MYDFTAKHVMSDYLVFSVKDMRDYKQDDYFFAKDYERFGRKQQKKLSEDLTPQHFEEEFKASNK